MKKNFTKLTLILFTKYVSNVCLTMIYKNVNIVKLY